MARALRAGHTLPTALEMVAEEIPDPVASEFKRLYDQQNYGMSLPEALKAFGERIPLLDARFFVTAVLIQRESGGNLSEVLDNLVDEDIIRALDDLPEQFRMAVILSDVEDFSYAEMAQIMDVPLGTVMSRLHRGRKALQKRLWELARERGIVKGQQDKPERNSDT